LAGGKRNRRRAVSGVERRPLEEAVNRRSEEAFKIAGTVEEAENYYAVPHSSIQNDIVIIRKRTSIGSEIRSLASHFVMIGKLLIAVLNVTKKPRRRISVIARNKPEGVQEILIG
jgi:hypothetical protein